MRNIEDRKNVEVVKRRLQPRSAWPQKDTPNGMYRMTVSDRIGYAVPDYDSPLVKPERKIFYIVREQLGNSMSRNSLFGHLTATVDYMLLLTEQKRTYLLARCICDCGKCYDRVAKTGKTATQEYKYCPIVLVPMQERKMYLISRGLIL